MNDHEFSNMNDWHQMLAINKPPNAQWSVELHDVTGGHNNNFQGTCNVNTPLGTLMVGNE